MTIIDIETVLAEIWQTEMKTLMSDGFLVYERQVQAEFYSILKSRFTKSELKVWMEPVLYFNDSNNKKAIPDLIITENEEIVCIIEMKFKPWEYVVIKHDIEKLEKIGNLKGHEFVLGIKPVSNNWHVQKEENEFLNYTINENVIKVFISFEKPGGNSFFIRKRIVCENLFHLFGSISNEGKLEFGIDKIKKGM